MRSVLRAPKVTRIAALGAFGALAIGIMAGMMVASTAPAIASDAQSSISLPEMDAEHGKSLFAERGCVICHAVNNVGGDSGPALDAGNLNRTNDPFDFFARMWGGAQHMLRLQQADLGYQIDFSGQDIADIFAFVQNAELQESFTEADLPDHIREIIDNGPSVDPQ
ncbi:c-type cytochrome [Thalassospira sp. MA62]|nr:c-type cytochrome [Thalassospira sp. MA62]